VTKEIAFIQRSKLFLTDTVWCIAFNNFYVVIKIPYKIIAIKNLIGGIKMQTNIFLN
jgi:hypothetical protein